MHPDTDHGPACPEAALLDRQFRLLREDMVRPLRESLAALGIAAPGAQQQLQPGCASTSAQPAMAAAKASKKPGGSSALLQRNVFPVSAVLGTHLKPRACVLVSVVLPMSHRAARIKSKKDREAFWSDSGRGTLPSDALVCIARRPRDGWQGSDPRVGGEDDFQPLAFGTIARREAAELAAVRPVVGLAFDRGQGEAAVRVLEQLGRGGRGQQGGRPRDGGGQLEEGELVLVQVRVGQVQVGQAWSQGTPGEHVSRCVRVMAKVAGAQQRRPWGLVSPP